MVQHGAGGRGFKSGTDPVAARALAAWLEGLEFSFADPILGADSTVAGRWGDWCNERPRPVIDTLLAATAAHHALIVVTHNLRDTSGLPLKVHNPWTE